MRRKAGYAWGWVDASTSWKKGAHGIWEPRETQPAAAEDLRLIVVDEEHDTSYKQDSPAPRYNGRETAIMMAKIFGANVILGSATPSLESLYNCSVGRYGLVTLNKRFYDAADSDIEIIDTIAERRKNGMIGNFSRKLIEHIGKCLGEHRQVLILRERRAYSPIVQCQ